MLWNTYEGTEDYIIHFSYVVCRKGCIHTPTIHEYNDGSCYYLDSSIYNISRSRMPDIGINNNLELIDTQLFEQSYISLQAMIARRGIC